MKIEELAKELFITWSNGHYVWELDKTEKNLWINLARHVQRKVLEARIEELELLHIELDKNDGDFGFTKEERLAVLTQQIKEVAPCPRPKR